jgi:hypothetical protein
MQISDVEEWVDTHTLAYHLVHEKALKYWSSHMSLG